MSSSDTSLTNSFVNINLDDVNADNVDQKPSDSSDNSTVEHPINDTESAFQSFNSKEPKPNASEKNVHRQTNEQLDRLGKQLMEDYAKYYRLNTSSQVDELNDCIDNLLTHMEEFYGLIEMIRTDSNGCLDQLNDSVHGKLDQCNQLFRMIDKLERIVRHVSLHLSLMDREVRKAEKMMGKKNAVSKLFSLISNQSSGSQSRYSSYVPPDIFKTEDLMKL